MKKPRNQTLFLVCLSLLAFQSCQLASSENRSILLQNEFPNVLNYTGKADSINDRSVFAFSDQGAWFGYSLPDEAHKGFLGSFMGPFLMTQYNGIWMPRALSQLKMDVSEKAVDLKKAELIELVSLPGKLRQVFLIKEFNLKVKMELVFANNRTALFQLAIENTGQKKSPEIKVKFSGSSFLNLIEFSNANNNIGIHFTDNDNQGLICYAENSNININSETLSYTCDLPSEQLKPGQTFTTHFTHTFCFSEKELAQEKKNIETLLSNPQNAFHQNAQTWNNKLTTIFNQLNPEFQNTAEKRIAVKCLQTLTDNWRSPAGFLKHEGLFPSYNYEWFHGFWSWDSWKHAVALAKYDTDLAQNQIRAMYDFQDDMGMIADCVYRDTVIESHNWRNTKPPLSAWAVWKVFEASKDIAFLKELFPKVEHYHQWWYQFRDHDQNGLCEYGSTDGSLIAAKWESGMDNAVRFDDTKIVQNNKHGWSMNRESVDLNAYLFAEKNYLSKIANELGEIEKTNQYTSDATALQSKIQNIFYEEESGWFYDIDLDTKKHLKAFGAEGWIPLWAKAASEEQAARVREKMLDSTKFATYIPFPTLAANHPKFKPEGGYWRGPIWLDQVYFAIKGLQQYGYKEDAGRFTKQLLDRLEGLKEDGAIRENYHPLTGKGLESNHFSWSAACLLLLMMEE